MGMIFVPFRTISIVGSSSPIASSEHSHIVIQVWGVYEITEPENPKVHLLAIVRKSSDLRYCSYENFSTQTTGVIGFILFFSITLIYLLTNETLFSVLLCSEYRERQGPKFAGAVRRKCSSKSPAK